MMQLTRRNVPAGTAATALAAGGAALAAAPPAGKQAPSYYRSRIGDLEVTVISDGAVEITVQPTMVRNRPLEDIKGARCKPRIFRPTVLEPVQSGAGEHRVEAGAA